MNVTNLEYGDNQFDGVIDKATFDSILVSTSVE
jgi:hypothetical protein